MSVTVPILKIFTLARERFKQINIFFFFKFVIIRRTVWSLIAGCGTTDEGTDGQQEELADMVST